MRSRKKSLLSLGVNYVEPARTRTKKKSSTLGRRRSGSVDSVRSTLSRSISSMKSFASSHVGYATHWKPFSNKSSKSNGTAHSGWLWRKIKGDEWQKCWFVLDATTLSLYEHDNTKEGNNLAVDQLAEGKRYVIHVRTLKKIELEKGSQIIKIDLKHLGGRLELRANSKRDAKEWCMKLQYCREMMREAYKSQKVSMISSLKELQIVEKGPLPSTEDFTCTNEEKENPTTEANETITNNDIDSTENSIPEDETAYSDNGTGSFVDDSIIGSIDYKNLTQHDLDDNASGLQEDDTMSIERQPNQSKIEYDIEGPGNLNYTLGRATFIEKVDQIKFIRDLQSSYIRRKSVMPILVDTTILKLDEKKKKDEQTKVLLERVLGNASFFLNNLVKMDRDVVDLIIENMFKVETKKGEVLVKEGSTEDTFYIIEKGRFNILKVTEIEDPDEENSKTFIDASGNLCHIVATKGKGAYLGELSLLYDQPATVSVRSLTKGIVWGLTRTQFREIREHILEQRGQEKQHILDTFDIDENLPNFADALERHVSRFYEVIVRPKTELKHMIFVMEGGIHVYDSFDNLVHEIKPGEVFGEIALTQKYICEYKLITIGGTTDTVYLTLDVDDFDGLLGSVKNKVLHKFREIDFTMKRLDVESIPRDKDEASSQEEATTKKKRFAKISHSFVMNTSRKPRKPPSGQKALTALAWVEGPPLLRNISFNDLKPLKKLGSGTFGNVYLVKHVAERPIPITDTADTFSPKYLALKIIPLAFIEKNGWQKNVSNELHAMKELSYHARSDFLVECYHTFADNINVYFLIGLAPGGDLFQYISERKGGVILSEKNARFYAACVLSGLAAIHGRKIIYRDLKPENVMICDNGYVKLADFGFSKKTIRSMTVCGTCDYMTPEVILSRGHGETVDFWALGILIYDLTHGRAPFTASSAMHTYKNILAYHGGNNSIVFENPYVTDDLKNMVTTLCSPKVLSRYYVIGGNIASYREHSFFEDFDWEAFQRLKMESPYVPIPQDIIYEQLEEIKISKPKAEGLFWRPEVDTFFT